MAKLIGVVGLIFLLGFPLQADAQSQEWNIQVVVPISDPLGKREIHLARYQHLHVILTNLSRDTKRIWKDWNTWGYFNLRLEWMDAQGITHKINRTTPKAWDGDFPDFWTIPPGESLVLNVDMSSGRWNGFPDLYGESIPASLKAIYENKPDELSADFGIWTGRMISSPVEVVFK
ncbi:MAG: hypothetical protein AAF206_22640 [Bacteroidota bacterium]